MMTMVEGTSIDLGDPASQDVEQIEIETPEERLLPSHFSVKIFCVWICIFGTDIGHGITEIAFQIIYSLEVKNM